MKKNNISGNILTYPLRITGGAEREAGILKSFIEALPDVGLKGKVCYVAADGTGDGTSENTPMSFENITFLLNTDNTHDINTILLKRSDVFRTNEAVKLKSDMTLGAYGNGAKPVVLGSLRNYADGNWLKTERENVWVRDFCEKDVGIILIDGCMPGRKAFSIDELKEYNDFVHYNKKLYILAQKNPNEYNSIEIGSNNSLISIVKNASNVTVSNIDLRYTGGHAIGCYRNNSVIISGCHIGWCGGSLQGCDEKTLYGNAIEFWDESSNILLKYNWIYQVYDAGLTFQGSGNFHDIVFEKNLIEYTTMAIEYWNTNKAFGLKKIFIRDNIIRFTGYGWGSNKIGGYGRMGHINTGWEPKSDYEIIDVTIENNIFDCSYQAIFRIPWANTKKEPDGYNIIGNTYFQRSRIGNNDLGFGEVEKNIVFFYGLLNTNNFNYYAKNQYELEQAVKLIDKNPKKICWIE